MRKESSDRIDIMHLRIRALMILASARDAAIDPMPAEVLHKLAYFSNLLAPLWNVPPLDGKILRLKRGPYYPDLQRQVDILVAMGVVRLNNLRYKKIEDQDTWHILADYSLDIESSNPILRCILEWEEEKNIYSFIRELVMAFSMMSDDDIGRAETQDATYSSNIRGYGNVIDFGEWQIDNPSVDAAEYFQNIVPNNVHLSRSNKLKLFVDHLDYRMTSGGAL